MRDLEDRVDLEDTTGDLGALEGLEGRGTTAAAGPGERAQRDEAGRTRGVKSILHNWDT